MNMEEAKRNLVIGFLVFAIEISFFYFFWKNNILLTALLLAVSAAILLKFSSKEERILYFVCFVLGPVFDLTLIPAGLWTYGNPTLFGVPLWLPVGYGLGTLMIVKIGTSIAKLIYFKQSRQKHL